MIIVCSSLFFFDLLARRRRFLNTASLAGVHTTGNDVILNLAKMVKKALNKATLPQRFDALFALTFALNQIDSWMHDNECYERGGECEKAVKRLATAWKAMLANNDAALLIDSEFTRPGVEALLNKFAEHLSKVERDDDSGYKFKWK